MIVRDGIDAELEALPADMSERLVVCCRSGGMSAIAARRLVKLRYTDVWNLEGGMIAWEQGGYLLADKARWGRRVRFGGDTPVG